jgi:hypothetical protein
MHAFKVELANASHMGYAKKICDEMERSSKIRGTGIAQRTTEYISRKMLEGKAVIAFSADQQWAGFCYIETWESETYVANSGLIIAPPFRNQGLAKSIKEQIFILSKTNYPDAKIFGLTTGLTVMKINSHLGYKPVTYSELTTDAHFWKGCQSCVNYTILSSKEFKNCLCTAMLYDQVDKKASVKTIHILPSEIASERKLFKLKSILKRLIQLKKLVLLKNK